MTTELGDATMSELDSDDINDDEELDGNLDDDEVEMDEEDFDEALDEAQSLAAGRSGGENARRRVEEYLEMRRAARELADLDSYDFD
ncbi:MAG: hypothetical protein P8080_02685 [Gammaproteobacteria bacterium]